MQILPIWAVIPTCGRTGRLLATVRSIFAQEVLPVGILIVDAGDLSVELGDLSDLADRCGVRLKVEKAVRRGAGPQRNQGVSAAGGEFIWFLDDDVDLQPGCLKALWKAMETDDRLGGCNAAIINQNYHSPGRVMRLLLALVGCPLRLSLAGRCCGPALNFLPALESGDDPQKTDWLNTTCTLYRRVVLPSPPFLPFFEGYSLMEDLALSLEVGKRWTLANCPGAKIFHDSQPAEYKSQMVGRQTMEMTNRWFVLSKIMVRGNAMSLLRLLGYQAFILLFLLVKPSQWILIPGWLAGTSIGLFRILFKSHSWKGYEKTY
jgi:GT2 family glycosyltransferase